MDKQIQMLFLMEKKQYEDYISLYWTGETNHDKEVVENIEKLFNILCEIIEEFDFHRSDINKGNASYGDIRIEQQKGLKQLKELIEEHLEKEQN